jgi:hypothetical protein
MNNSVIKRVISNPDQVGRQLKISKTSMYDTDGEDGPRINIADHQNENVAIEEEVIAGIHTSLHIENSANKDIGRDALNQNIIKDRPVEHRDTAFIEDANLFFEGGVIHENSLVGIKEIPRQVSVDSSTRINTTNYKKKNDYGVANRKENGVRSNPVAIKGTHTEQDDKDPRMEYEESRGRSKSSSSSDRGSSSQLAKDWGWFEDVHFGETDGKGDDESPKITKDDVIKSIHNNVKDIEGATTDGKKKKLKLFFDSMVVNDVDEVVPKKGMFSLFCEVPRVNV